MKTKNTTLSEQFQNIHCNRNIVDQAKSIPLTQKYMTAHFPGLVQALQQKGVGVKPGLSDALRVLFVYNFQVIIKKIWTCLFYLWCCCPSCIE
jgi:hypothetical protein